jgi:hypothetical protein
MSINGTLPLRLQLYTSLLAQGWDVYIKTLLPESFGQAYTPQRQAEAMLTALAVGAGRWIKNPKAKVPRGLSIRKKVERMAKQDRSIDHVELDMIESLARLVHRCCQGTWCDLELEDDARAMFVPLQLSSMRAGAAQAFADLFPASTTLAALDSLLRENAPADMSWWELDGNIRI